MNAIPCFFHRLSLLWWASCFFLFGVLGSFAHAFALQDDAQSQTLLVTLETRWRPLRLPASVEPRHDVVLTTTQMAQVMDLPVAQGQFVEAGTLLIGLRDHAIQQRRLALEQALTANQNQIKQAVTQAERMARLLERGAVAAVDSEQATLRVSALVAEGKSLQAQFEQLEEQADFLQIRAPAAGQLSRLEVGLGDIAKPGQPLGRGRQGIRLHH